MDKEGFNNNEDPPVPPQPPQFSTCSAVPGSPEWFTYWASEAKETFEYNRRIADYGKEMERWSRKVAGLSVESVPDITESLPEPEPPKPPPIAAETQTAEICRQEVCTSSLSLQTFSEVLTLPPPPVTIETQTAALLCDILSCSAFPSVVTLDGSDLRRNVRMLNTNPYMDIFDELVDFPCDDSIHDDSENLELKRYLSHEVEIIREYLNVPEAQLTTTNPQPKLLEQNDNAVDFVDVNLGNPETVNITVTENIAQEVASDPVENKPEKIDLEDIKEALTLPNLRANMENRITDVVKTIFNGLTEFVVNIKEGISGMINDMKADAKKTSQRGRGLPRPGDSSSTNNGLVDFQQSFLNNQWKDPGEYSHDGRQTPKSLNSHTSEERINPGSKEITASNSSHTNSEICEKAEEVLEKSLKTPVFRAAMELGAFEINTWKEANGSTVRSGTACRILCFSFKRVTTNDGTRLVFDKSVIDEGSLEVNCQISDDRFSLRVTACRNGKMEELTIFLPEKTDFEEIKIVEISKRYLSVSIPFATPYSEMNKRERHSGLLDDVH